MGAPLYCNSFHSSAGFAAYSTVGGGQDVVLVHGTPTNAAIWQEVVDRLKRRYRLHLLDLPGYGASEKFEGQDVRLRSFARVLREYIEHRGLERPHLVGHDFGAATVLGAHLIEQVAVASITVADGVVLNPWGTSYSLHVRAHEQVFAEVPEYIHRATLTAHLQTAVARPMPAWAMSAILEPWMGPAGQPAYYRQVAHYDHDYTARLETLYPRISVPTLILWGEEDAWVDIAVGRRLQSLIPGARFESLPDAGHFSMLDAPDLFARLLNVWLSPLPERSASRGDPVSMLQS
jgi:pimeloyl-ACP methyl ester carboxylesterase